MASGQTSYGTLYYVFMFAWCFGRGAWDCTLNIVAFFLRCCYTHRRRAVLPESLTGKTVIITGANGGIGKETARIAARLGAKVIFACRNADKAKEAIQEILKSEEDGKIKSENLVFVKLDLSSLASVRNAAMEILDSCSAIDVLINNGGVMMTPQWETADGLEYQLQTNYLGHFLLTILLLPKLKAAPAARIVNVASLAFSIGYTHFDNLNLKDNYNPLRSYGRSKLYQLLTTFEFAKRLKETGSNITTYALHPGVVNTGITQHFNCFLRIFVLAFNKLAMISPEMGAQTSLHCAFSKEAGCESGFYYENCKRLKKIPSHATNAEDAARLWELSFKLCDLVADKNNNNV